MVLRVLYLDEHNSVTWTSTTVTIRRFTLTRTSYQDFSTLLIPVQYICTYIGTLYRTCVLYIELYMYNIQVPQYYSGTKCNWYKHKKATKKLKK